MQDKDQNPDSESKKEAESGQKTSSFSIKKMIIFAVPVFIIQVVIIYFLVAKFVFPLTASQPTVVHDTEKVDPAIEIQTEEINLFVVGDIVINPAGTNATRFLLTTIGMQVSTEDTYTEMDRKELQVRDALNTILSSKRLDELVNVEHRPLLRKEISEKVNSLLQTGKVEQVYFSKFIIQ